MSRGIGGPAWPGVSGVVVAVLGGRQVEGGIAIEEAVGPELEPDRGDRHHRPVLRPDHVVRGERMTNRRERRTSVWPVRHSMCFQLRPCLLPAGIFRTASSVARNSSSMTGG